MYQDIALQLRNFFEAQTAAGLFERLPDGSYDINTELEGTDVVRRTECLVEFRELLLTIDYSTAVVCDPVCLKTLGNMYIIIPQGGSRANDLNQLVNNTFNLSIWNENCYLAALHCINYADFVTQVCFAQYLKYVQRACFDFYEIVTREINEALATIGDRIEELGAVPRDDHPTVIGVCGELASPEMLLRKMRAS